MRFYWIEYRVKQKELSLYWKPVSQNMEDYFTKHHPPHHHEKIWATYLYMENAILKLNHKIVQGWENDVLKINHLVVQGCVDVVYMYIRTYEHSKLPTVT